MSKLVSFTQLKATIEGVWTKVKNRDITRGTFNKGNKTVTLERTDGNLNVVLTDVAITTEENSFTQKNTFDKLHLGTKKEITDTWTPAGGQFGAGGGTKKFGRRSFTSTSGGNSGYVSKLLIAVANRTAGQTVNVNVWEVKKGATRANDIPTLIASNKVLTVKDADAFSASYLKNQKFVEYPINKFYKDETYFIYQVIPSDQAYTVQAITTPDEDYIFLGNSEDVTTSGIQNQANKQACGIHALIGGDVSINDILGNAGSGTVKSVNGASADINGNVQLTLTELTDVQDALNEKLATTTAESTYIKKTDAIQSHSGKVAGLDASDKIPLDLLPNLNLTNVKNATDDSQANGFVDDSSIQIGDIVVLNNGKVYMYTNQAGTSFSDRFIQIKSTDGTITNVNGVTDVDGDGRIDIKANEIKLSDNVTVLETELKTRFKKINNMVEATAEGNIDLVFELSGNKFLLKANTNEVASINVMEASDVSDIIDNLPQ